MIDYPVMDQSHFLAARAAHNPDRLAGAWELRDMENVRKHIVHGAPLEAPVLKLREGGT